MPPPLGESCRQLRDPTRLSGEERDQLRDLAASLPAGGSGASAHAQQIAAPLGHVTIEKPWLLPAAGPMRTRSFAIEAPPSLRGRQVGGMRACWSDARAVRSVAAAPDPQQLSRVMQSAGESGYEAMGDVGRVPSGALGACGADGRFDLPPGYSMPFAAEGDIVIEVQAQPLGRAVPVAGTIEWTAAEPGSVPVESSLCGPPPSAIPAGATDIVLHSSLELAGRDLVGFLPRAGSLVRSIEVSLHPGDGGPAQQLLSIADWNPEFRRPVLFATPLAIETAARLEVRFTIDNSEANQRNPWSPPRDLQPDVPPYGESPSLLVWHAPRRVSGPRAR